LRLLRKVATRILSIYISISIQIACKRFSQLKKI